MPASDELLTSPLPKKAEGGGEASAWRGIHGTWQPLYGRFFEEGLSVEWHDFRVDSEMDWSRSFHPGCLEICLNFSGSGWLLDGSTRRRIAAEQIAMYTTHAGRLRALREAGNVHRFITVELGRCFLQRHFADMLDRLKDPVRRFIENEAAPPLWLEIAPLSPALQAIRAELLRPPVPHLARAIWYRGKALEILAQSLFAPASTDELFCHRQQRLNRERATRVRYLLERDLTNPPTLEMLAQEIGCSPFHLSRIFAEETGGSIPKFLRTKRIERAAELLRTGKMNVTEAAFSVGYASLGAFNKAFVEIIGCCPGLYPAVKIAGRKAKVS
jgi:AraC-like DNA-binding protein